MKYLCRLWFVSSFYWKLIESWGRDESKQGINLFNVIFKLGSQSKWQLKFIKSSNKQLVFLIPEFLFNALTLLFAQ